MPFSEVVILRGSAERGSFGGGDFKGVSLCITVTVSFSFSSAGSGGSVDGREHFCCRSSVTADSGGSEEDSGSTDDVRGGLETDSGSCDGGGVSVCSVVDGGDGCVAVVAYGGIF
ncbi:hypothetical protein OROMI_010165 [Orobanche minor]